jgi:hypothetical protein
MSALAAGAPRAAADRTLTGVGHNLAREAPLDFVHVIEEVSNFT